MCYYLASAPAFVRRRLDHGARTAGNMASVNVHTRTDRHLLQGLLTCSSSAPRAKAFICEISIPSYCVPIMDINQLSQVLQYSVGGTIDAL